MRLARKSGFIVVTGIVILLFCFSSSFIDTSVNPASVSGPAKLSKMYFTNYYYSWNWAGYAINATAGSVTMAKGSWIQPSVTCPTTSLSVAAFWVGIDGLTSPTVEQIGTLAQCLNGAASYYAWYEFYPSGSVVIPRVILVLPTRNRSVKFA